MWNRDDTKKLPPVASLAFMMALLTLLWVFVFVVVLQTGV